MSINNEALQFYIDNGLDEFILDEAQNHFLMKDAVKKKQNKVQEAVKIEEKIITQEVKKEFAKEVTPIAENNFVKPVASLSQAISGLAKKAQNNGGFTENLSMDKIIQQAKSQAQNANNLDELKLAVENFDGCNLKKMATNTVFSDGNKESDIMVIGEAPGNDEDLQGVPFCGEAGNLLDAMFGAINLSRKEDLYLTNVLFWRPPGNRKPTNEELAMCKPFVQRHIELFNPKILILVGATAMSAVTDSKETISKVRGQITDFAPEFLSEGKKLVTIFHPSYLMRQPSKKKIAWQDMLLIEEFLSKKSN